MNDKLSKPSIDIFRLRRKGLFVRDNSFRVFSTQHTDFFMCIGSDYDCDSFSSVQNGRNPSYLASGVVDPRKLDFRFMPKMTVAEIPILIRGIFENAEDVENMHLNDFRHALVCARSRSVGLSVNEMLDGAEIKVHPIETNQQHITSGII